MENDGREQITIQDIREWAKSGVGRSLAEIDLNKISRNIKDDSIKVGAKNIVTKSRVYTIVTERFYHGSYLSKVEYEDYNGTEVELADIVLSPPFDSASLSVLGNSALETFILYCSLVMNLNTNLWVSSQEAFFTSVEEAINATNAAKTHSPNSPANSTMTRNTDKTGMVKKIDANRITFESIKNWVKERSPWADLNIDFIDIGTIDRAFVNQISGIKTGVTTTVTKENVYAIPSNLTLHEDEKAGSPVHFDAEPLISCTVGYLDGNGHAVEFDEIDLNPLFSWAKDECDDGYRKEAITVFVQYIMLVSGCVASIWVTSKGTFFDTLDWAIGSVRICKEDILSGAALWSKPKGTLCSVIAHGKEPTDMQQYQTWKITHLEEQIKALEGQVGILETQNDSIRGRLADTLRTAEATKDELEKLRQDSHLLHEALLSERGLHNDLKEKHETLVGRIRDVMSEVSEATE